MARSMPDFAMLIGKPKKSSDSSRDNLPDDAPSAEDHADDLGVGKDAQEDSAVRDLLAAMKSSDVSGAKAALQDFLELCYPQLGDQDADQPDESSEEDSGAVDLGAS